MFSWDAVAWYLVGVVSFIYWWTKDYDFAVKHIFAALALGIIGPFAFLIGALIHGGGGPVLIRRRRHEDTPE